MNGGVACLSAMRPGVADEVEGCWAQQSCCGVCLWLREDGGGLCGAFSPTDVSCSWLGHPGAYKVSAWGASRSERAGRG
ncbi:hypothetical protein NDU88_000757 [Pleurodeles waltl]|uniref:Uncharacterized protein n=1 Tax=Pleurodeles waltl TaxID=8319 RepID=A0AAV7VYF9_PLEWA|nr:hypothetical protein NDU88_000757 [Pleurodeles waltl]